MKPSDALLVSLNALLVLFSLLGIGSTDEEMLIVGAMLALVTGAVNAIVLLRRRDRAPRQSSAAPVDELDARSVLDLDARLEALEQAQADAADAARWRALVERGSVTSPATEASDDADNSPSPRGHTRNGHR